MPSGGSLSSALRSDASRSTHERRAMEQGEEEAVGDDEGRARGLEGEGWLVGVDVEDDTEDRVVAEESGVVGVL